MNQCNCLEYREVIDTLTAKVKRYETALDIISKIPASTKNGAWTIARAALNQGEGKAIVIDTHELSEPDAFLVAQQLNKTKNSLK